MSSRPLQLSDPAWRWAQYRAREHRRRFLISGCLLGLALALLNGFLRFALPAHPDGSDYGIYGVLVWAVAVVAVVTATYLWALIRAPYEQRDSARHHLSAPLTTPSTATSHPIRKTDLQFYERIDEQTGIGFDLGLRVHNNAARAACLRAQVVDAEGGPRTLGKPPPWLLAGDGPPTLRVPPDGDAILNFAHVHWLLRREADRALVWSGNPGGDPSHPSVSVALGLVALGGGVLEYAAHPIRITVKVWIDETDELVGTIRTQIAFEEVPANPSVAGHLRPTMFIVDRSA